MPAKTPRVNITVEPGLFGILTEMAEANAMPLSVLARDLIKEALELREDAALAGFAEDRDASFDPKTALTHEQVWS